MKKLFVCSLFAGSLVLALAPQSTATVVPEPEPASPGRCGAHGVSCNHGYDPCCSGLHCVQRTKTIWVCQ